MKDWTQVVTQSAVASSLAAGSIPAAKGNLLKRMPEGREELLGIDVMAFEESQGLSLFPVAALELVNSCKGDRVAFSLWKVLNLRTRDRAMLCYRPSAEEEVAHVLGIPEGDLEIRGSERH